MRSMRASRIVSVSIGNIATNVTREGGRDDLVIVHPADGAHRLVERRRHRAAMDVTWRPHRFFAEPRLGVELRLVAACGRTRGAPDRPHGGTCPRARETGRRVPSRARVPAAALNRASLWSGRVNRAGSFARSIGAAGGCSASSCVGLFVFRQAFELIGEHHRLVRRHLELLAARLAGHLVVEAQQVIAQLVELGAVLALRLAILALGAPHPAEAVLVDPLASRTRILRRPVFRLLDEECFLVKRHT